MANLYNTQVLGSSETWGSLIEEVSATIFHTHVYFLSYNSFVTHKSWSNCHYSCQNVCLRVGWRIEWLDHLYILVRMSGITVNYPLVNWYWNTRNVAEVYRHKSDEVTDRKWGYEVDNDHGQINVSELKHHWEILIELMTRRMMCQI